MPDAIEVITCATRTTHTTTGFTGRLRWNIATDCLEQEVETWTGSLTGSGTSERSERSIAWVPVPRYAPETKEGEMTISIEVSWQEAGLIIGAIESCADQIEKQNPKLVVELLALAERLRKQFDLPSAPKG